MLFLVPIYLAAVCQIATAAKRCCVADQFHCSLLEISGTLLKGSSIPTITEERFLLNFDYNALMDRLDGNSYDHATGKTQNITIINDYKLKKTYTIVGNNCSIMQNNGIMATPCIPENFDYKGTSSIGFGSRAVRVNEWSGIYQNHLQMTLIVTEDTCLPVTQNIYGTLPDGSVRLVRALNFANVIENSLSEPSILKLPNSCMPDHMLDWLTAEYVILLK